MHDRPDPERLVLSAMLGALLLLTWTPEVAGQAADAPLPSDKVEEVSVDLLIVDVFALDTKGRPVPDLAVEDFELLIDYRPVSVDTFDVACPAQRADGSSGLHLALAGAEPIAPDPKIVVAMDYLHLKNIQRAEVIAHLEEMVKQDDLDGFPLMLVALTGGLRVEQPFTSDRGELLASLERMLSDPTLATPDFYHQNSSIFTDQFEALFDLLGTVPGNKAVVLFSSITDSPLDSQFKRIAALAATSRSAIYPVDVRGLRTTQLLETRAPDIHGEARKRLFSRPATRPSIDPMAAKIGTLPDFDPTYFG